MGRRTQMPRSRLRGIVSGIVAAALGCSSTAFLAGHHLGRRGTRQWKRPVSAAAAPISDPPKEEDVSSLWKDALVAERERSELLFAELAEVAGEDQLEKEASALRRLGDGQFGARPEECALIWGEDEFEQLRACNDALQQGIDRLRGASRQPPPEAGPSGSGRLDGIGVAVESLPPVPTSGEFALVAGAPHVRVSLPLGLNGLMWGSDLTPLFDEEGERLMVFVATLPLGMRIATADRPSQAPAWDGGVIVVEAVSPSSEAERIGIRPGDFLRAVSYMAPGEEPGFLDKMLGAEAMKMPQVLKVDGLGCEEVTEALVSNTETPDGTLTLLLERPP